MSSVALSGRRLRRHVPDIPTESHRLRDNGLRLDHQGGVVQELPSALEELDLCQLWSAADRPSSQLRKTSPFSMREESPVTRPMKELCTAETKVEGGPRCVLGARAIATPVAPSGPLQPCHRRGVHLCRCAERSQWRVFAQNIAQRVSNGGSHQALLQMAVTRCVKSTHGHRGVLPRDRLGTLLESRGRQNRKSDIDVFELLWASKISRAISRSASACLRCRLGHCATTRPVQKISARRI